MYFNEVQQGLWHYFPSSTKVLIPWLSKPLRNMCFKEDIFLLPGISRMLYFKDCCQFSLGPYDGVTRGWRREEILHQSDKK